MFKVALFSVKHPLFVNLCTIMVCVAGIASMFLLQREMFPNISFDTVIVATQFRGAAAEDVEKLVTVPLEKELREVDDIDDMLSASREGASTITLVINPDARDKAKVVDDIQKAVDRVTALPDGVDDRPLVQEITSKQIPVIKISLSGGADEFVLRRYAEQLRDQLADVPGVAAVDRMGWRKEEFWVEPDLSIMRRRHISMEEIMQALGSRNVTIPGGKLKLPDEEWSIKTLGEFSSKEEMEQVIIRANDQGNVVRVNDVAQVRHTFEDQNELYKAMGKRSITLVVLKKEKSDAIEVVDAVRKKIGAFQAKLPPDLKCSAYDDLSYYIKRRLGVLSSNGLYGFVLVLLVLFIYLHFTPAFFTALGIPITIFATLAIMQLTGININMMSMVGLIIVLGMVVDDAIIVCENVYRYVEAGMPVREAVLQGTAEVIAPVTATIVTTIVAFSPLMFMRGIIGKFIYYIPLMVIIALLVSLVESFICLPSHLADFLKPVQPKNGKAAHGGFGFHVLVAMYQKILSTALRWRYAVAALAFAAFIGAIATVAFGWFGMKFVLFPARGIEEFLIYAEAPVGTPLEKMNMLLQPVEDAVAAVPNKYVAAFDTVIGMASQGGRAGDPYARYGTHLATLTVYLTPLQDRDKEAREIIALVRPKLAGIAGFDKLYLNEVKPGPPVGKAVDVQIRGEEFFTLREIADKIKKFLRAAPGVSDIADSYDLGNRELRVVVDHETAARAGLTVGRIAAAVRTAFDGGLATTIKQSKAEDEIKVLVRLPLEQRQDRRIFSELLIPNTAGNLVPLSAVARLEEQQSMRTITHLDGKRSLSVTAEVDAGKKTSPLQVNRAVAKQFRNLADEYPGYEIRFKGEQEETNKSLRSLVIAFLIALLSIFMILAVQFDSLVQPFIVMLTIPFSLTGVVISFLAHGEPLSFLAIVGIVGLAGVVVNDSIVLVDFINKLRQQAKGLRESIVQAACLRLRPIMLTTWTTVLGLSTVTYGIGGFDPFLKPLTLAMGWGLFFSTALTLIVIPCVYAIVDDLTMKIACHPSVISLRRNGAQTCAQAQTAAEATPGSMP
ncbi:MAG: efflux RND transporter permease subunit [Candidatus Omnitrophica bacterium]|nr:efflux RND transporter permease subunit [Candidatus Omnitrophota bacterium]